MLNTATGTVTGTRYYTIGGTTIAARTSSGTVDYLIADQQNTSLLSIDSNTGDVTRRYYDPYGNPVGTPPPSWPGTRGFTGGTADPATGLTNLGAREYDPGTASFISPDPLLDPTDPQDLNPYAYAGDSPATNDDPSGQRLNAPAGSCAHNACSGVNWGPNPSSYPRTQGNWGYHSTGQQPSDGCPPVPFVCGGAVVPGFSGSGWVPKATASPPPPPAPKPVVRKITNGNPASQLADCTGRLFWLGACPSERAAAGTTPQQVKQSFLGASAILAGAILGPLLGALGAAADAGTAAEDAGDAVDPIAARLQAHADAAASQFDSGELKMSQAQAARAGANSSLRPLFRGQVIDAAVKQAAANDPELGSLYITRSGEFGPDFLDLNSVPGTPRWYDVTTQDNWLAHVTRYADFGQGTGIFYGGG